MSSKDIMIIDYDKCVRVERGDEFFARPTELYYCVPCAREAPTGETLTDEATGKTHRPQVRYLTDQPLSAKLRFQGQKVPTCENHNPPVEMEPRHV